ncbi:MAG: hypothetical protein A2488_01955 [Candidatus Magasanikbacteria bacterium RIFOXYC12_FULL_32_21b]|nr:MAG: hypothetical protein A2488_01955 [Candidatus Magasanikbacteria bacterium RIFOXYC12_FULL_32_21b]
MMHNHVHGIVEIDRWMVGDDVIGLGDGLDSGGRDRSRPVPTDVVNNLDIPTKTKPSISLKYRVQTLFFYAQPKLVAGLDKTSKMCYIILLI